jgi:integrase
MNTRCFFLPALGKRQLDPCPAHLEATRASLAGAALADSTKKAYKKTWKEFASFVSIQCPGENPVRPSSKAVQWFICHLVKLGRKARTVRSAVSALGYLSQENDGEDFGKNFHVRQLLRGLDKSRCMPDIRSPITEGKLEELLREAARLGQSGEEVLLFQTMFVTMFFGLLRVGEVTVATDAEKDTGVTRQGVAKEGDSRTLTMTIFKHNTTGDPHVVVLRPRPHGKRCPVQALDVYLTQRGEAQGPLFLFRGKPLLRKAFDAFFNRCLAGLGWDPRKFKGHSFRIGGATWAAQEGYSDAQIRAMGRWKSSAFLGYIRSFSVRSKD